MNLDRLFLKGVGALVAGIVLGDWLKLPMAWIFGLGVLLLAGLFKTHLWRYGFYGLMVILGMGILTWAYLPQRELGVYEHQSVVVEGQVVSSPLGKYYILLAPKAINGQPIYSRAQLVVEKKYGDETLYERGQQVTVTGVIQAPLPSTNPGGFSEAGYWATQGIFQKLDAEDLGEIVAPSQGIWRFTNELAGGIEANLAKYLSEETHQLVLALLLGEKGVLDPSLYSLSQKLGIAHVFAVSGLHVGFVVAFVLGFLRLFKWDKSWWAVLLLGAILVIYTLLTGCTPSAIRASIMAILALVAYKWLRFKDIYTIIAIAALVILLANPLALWAVGFQLSFVTTWGLIYFYPLAKKIWRFIPSKWLVNALAVATAAQLASLPLVAYHFYMVAFFAPLFNTWVVPLIGIIVPLLLLGLCLSLVLPFLAGVIFSFSEALLVLLSAGLNGFAQVIGSGHFYVGQPSLAGLALYYFLLVLIREGHLRWVAKPLVNKGIWLALILLGLRLWWPQPINNDQVVILDVGQGSSAVARTKEGYVAIFDSGPTKDTTASYLRYSAINQIDVLILSHGDKDHTTGLAKMVQDFSIGYILLKEADASLENLVDSLQLAQAKGTKILLLKEEMVQLQLGQGTLLRTRCYGQTSENTNTLEVVSAWHSGGHQVVFPGDLDSKNIDGVVKDLGVVDLWAVPHHGSKNSCSPGLYQGFHPGLAAISAGRDNQYGHPHPEVLAALDKAGISYGRTDLQGALLVTFGDEGAKMEGYIEAF